MPEHAVPVAIQGWTSSTYLLVALNLILGGGFTAAIVKVWPQLKTIAAASRRDDLDDLRSRVGTLEGQVQAANTAAHRAEMKLVYAVNAFQLLAGRIRSDDPNDPVLKQANDLLQLAATGDLSIWMRELDPLAKAMAKSQKEGEA